MKKILLATLSLVIIFSACKKDKDEEVDQQVNEQNLVGSYTLGSFMVKYGSNPEVDGSAVLQTCQKDDIITLKADLTSDYTDAGVQCSPSGSFTGNWSLSGNIITIDAQIPISGTVTRLTNKTATIVDTDVQGGITVVSTFVLNRQ